MATSFTKTNWQDAPSTATPITAAQLNRIEKGIEDCSGQGNENELAIAANAEAIQTFLGDIPTKTSELENDSGFIDDTAFENYYTKTEVDEKTVVDQTYSPTSENAQSGKAVEEALNTSYSTALLNDAFTAEVKEYSQKTIYEYPYSKSSLQFVFKKGTNFPASGIVNIVFAFISTFENGGLKDNFMLKTNDTDLIGSGTYVNTYNVDSVADDENTIKTVTMYVNAATLKNYFGLIWYKKDSSGNDVTGGNVSVVDCYILNSNGTKTSLFDCFLYDLVCDAFDGTKTAITPTIKKLPYTFSSIALSEKVIINKASKVTGCKMGIIGDSITVGYTALAVEDGAVTQHGTVEKKWWEIVAERYGIITTQTIAAVGACYALDGSQDNARFTSRLTELAADCDIIGVFGGTNDYYRNVTLGTINDVASGANGASFYAAVKYTMEYLLNNYPDKYIFFITPLQRNYLNDGFNTKNSNGNYLYEYVNVIKQLGAIYGVQVVDLYAYSQFHVFSDNFKAKYCLDGLHPNTEGTKKYTKNGIIPTLDKMFFYN